MAAVADEEGLLFLRADAPGELSGKVALQIESGVGQKLLRNLDDGADLVRIELHLTEHIIALGVLTFLVNPRRAALGGYDGNLVGTAGSGDDLGVVANDVPLFQPLHKRMLILIRNQVTTLSVHTLLERVTHFGHHAVTCAGLRPERLPVGIGSTAGPGVRLGSGFGLGGERRGGGRVHLPLDGLLALHATDFAAQVDNLLLHTVIDFGLVSGQNAAFVTMGIQECFGLVPGPGALFTQFGNLIHCKILLKV